MARTISASFHNPIGQQMVLDMFFLLASRVDSSAAMLRGCGPVSGRALPLPMN
jgi:hypothetical protein